MNYLKVHKATNMAINTPFQSKIATADGNRSKTTRTPTNKRFCFVRAKKSSTSAYSQFLKQTKKKYIIASSDISAQLICILPTYNIVSCVHVFFFTKTSAIFTQTRICLFDKRLGEQSCADKDAFNKRNIIRCLHACVCLLVRKSCLDLFYWNIKFERRSGEGEGGTKCKLKN